MAPHRCLLVDAFTDEPLTGNAAGVVPDGDSVPADRAGAIARELAVSETAIVESADDAAVRLRYFTPSGEIDLCGHATVAACTHLRDAGRLDTGEATVATAAGPVPVRIEDDTVHFRAPDSTVSTVDVDYGRVAAALDVDPATLRDVGADLAPAVATAGVPFLLVPVNFLEQLGSTAPDPAAVAAVCADHDAVGLYAFTFDTLSPGATLHARAFAPGIGIDEDPVTGTASAGVARYLIDRGIVEGTAFVFEQGHYLDRPGRVHVDVDDDVWVGGTAVTALDGDLRVPDRDGDDIVEA
ncbi:PhzF family phenazine biosynthesis protein [Halobacteriales archaeon SW_7_68_16]|nr:MAG: PhzF family phenazine biosynthesis protein [Halobacteriales archaeon SW_7_68_16]